MSLLAPPQPDYPFRGLPCTHHKAHQGNLSICPRCGCEMTEEGQKAYAQQIKDHFLSAKDEQEEPNP
jgi:hypothetical protein